MEVSKFDQCYVYGGVVDLRKGAPGLSALISQPQEGVLYLFGNPHGNVCFDWQLGRGRAAAESILKDFNGGLLQSDGYAAYDSVTSGTDIIQLGLTDRLRYETKLKRSNVLVVSHNILISYHSWLGRRYLS